VKHDETARFIPGSSVLPLKVTGKNVKFDITSAKISNRSLLPWNISTDAMQSKMVDYAIVIKLSCDFSSATSQCLHSRIIEKLRPEIGVATINQTASEWVRFKSIALNPSTSSSYALWPYTSSQLSWPITTTSQLLCLMMVYSLPALMPYGCIPTLNFYRL